LTKSSMISIAHRISFLVVAAVLLMGMTALMVTQPDACDTTSCLLTAPSHAHVDAGGPMPTLAPPQKLVVVKVEVDKPDLQIGWVEGN
jgi:hypothetical protein